MLKLRDKNYNRLFVVGQNLIYGLSLTVHKIKRDFEEIYYQYRIYLVCEKYLK